YSPSVSMKPPLTVREHFASMAMQSLLEKVTLRINSSAETFVSIDDLQKVAKDSILMANLMIQELNKENNEG
ncbi:hypothetical protein, partial [Mesomycoplasma ovipneumoniae]|uniref:hypothetical protein n=1 Tax=Mesomycoplasma ovipneumoniae TaxID=29562 RepID=UPI0030802400